MRILGPDGHPIESGPAVPPEARQYVERAKVIAENGDPASALQQMVFAFQYDVSSDLVLDTTCALLALMQQQSGAATSDELEMLCLPSMADRTASVVPLPLLGGPINKAILCWRLSAIRL